MMSPKVLEGHGLIIWDPETSGINAEINILEYLGPTRTEEEKTIRVYSQSETRTKVAQGKTKRKKK